MKLPLICFAALVSVVGCAATHSFTETPKSPYVTVEPPQDVMPETFPVYIDTLFTAKEHDDIHGAVSDWNTALNGYMTYIIGSDTFDMEPEVIRSVLRTGQGLLILRNKFADYKDDEDIEGTLAFVYRLGAPVVHVLEDVIGTRDFKSIVLHEMGHTLGIPHVYIRGSLMFPSYPYGANCIDKATVQTLSSIRPWFEWRHMRYCERPR